MSEAKATATTPMRQWYRRNIGDASLASFPPDRQINLTSRLNPREDKECFALIREEADRLKAKFDL
jgi:hypothetical protein